MQAQLTEFLLTLTFQNSLYTPKDLPSSLSSYTSPSQNILANIYLTINAESNLKTTGQHKSSFCEETAPQPLIKCNCLKSKCLKLYCQCFSRGSFCNDCNCECCYNKEEFIEIRARALDEAIMKAQIPFGLRSASIKGCNCKKTGCQKKYCECFNQGIGCNEFCKCVNCENISCS